MTVRNITNRDGWRIGDKVYVPVIDANGEVVDTGLTMCFVRIEETEHRLWFSNKHLVRTDK